MRFRPISVWLSATLDVAESHKINTQSDCSRQLTMISCSLLLLISIAPVSPGNESCKRYANLFGAEPDYVLGTNRKRITREHSSQLTAKFFEIPEVESFTYQVHRGLGDLSGTIRAIRQNIAYQSHVGFVIRPLLADRVEKLVESCGKFLLDLNIANSAPAIPVLEIRHLFPVGIEHVVVQKDGVTLNMSGIGSPEPRRIRIH